MKMCFTIKEVIILFLVMLFTSFLSVGMYHAVTVYAGTGAEWISGLISAVGNIIGGFMGGIVAFIAAAYQVGKTIEIDKSKKEQNSQSLLKLVKEELEENRHLISCATPMSASNYDLLKSQLTDDIWKYAMSNLVIDEGLLRDIYICYRQILLIKNIGEEKATKSVLDKALSHIEQTKKLISDSLIVS